MFTITISSDVPAGFLTEFTQLCIKYHLVFNGNDVKSVPPRSNSLPRAPGKNSKKVSVAPTTNRYFYPSSTFRPVLLKTSPATTGSGSGPVSSTPTAARPEQSKVKSVRTKRKSAPTSNSGSVGKEKQPVKEVPASTTSSTIRYHDFHDDEGRLKPFRSQIVERPLIEGKAVVLNEAKPLYTLQFLARVRGMAVRKPVGMAPVVEYPDKYVVYILPHSLLERTYEFSKKDVSDVHEARSAAIVSAWHDYLSKDNFSALHMLPVAYVNERYPNEKIEDIVDDDVDNTI